MPIELALIPAGEFLMGSDESDRESERPVHPVRLARPFYLAIHPLTVGHVATLDGTPPPPAPDLPDGSLSWIRATEICEQLSQAAGRVVRLPTEAEWEYACRAGTTTRFAFGDTLSPDQAEFLEETGDLFDRLMSSPRPLSPVCSFPPNPWGLHDMHGGVPEWCADPWHDDYNGAPDDGRAWTTAVSDPRFTDRVVRGGSIESYAVAARSAARSMHHATDQTAALRLVLPALAQDTDGATTIHCRSE